LVNSERVWARTWRRRAASSSRVRLSLLVIISFSLSDDCLMLMMGIGLCDRDTSCVENAFDLLFWNRHRRATATMHEALDRIPLLRCCISVKLPAVEGLQLVSVQESR